jgi:hypothetical protein
MVAMAKRLAVFVYGLVSYKAFFLTFVYAVGLRSEVDGLHSPNVVLASTSY